MTTKSQLALPARLRYQSRLFREGVGGPPGCTLEYDGRVRWLGRPALLDVLTQAVSRPGQKSEEEEYRTASDISRVQKSVYSTVYLSFGRHRPLRKLGLDLFSRQVLAYVALVLPEVTGPTPQERGVGTPEERW